MWNTRLVERIAIGLVIATGAQFGTACSGDDQHPTAANTSIRAALSNRAPSPRSTAIRARVADARRRSLTGDEQARVASLKGKWQWVADLHHAAMQEAIHDPSLHGLRQPRTNAERCAIAVRYMAKYSPAVEGRTGLMYESADERTNAMKNMAARGGLCPPAPVAFAFATSDSIRPVVRDYVAAMVADIRNARDLADANAILDAYLATASADAAVPPMSLALIAGTVDLAASSALEWDTYGQMHQASLFWWDWLSTVGSWIADVVGSDLEGCGSGIDTSPPDIIALALASPEVFVDTEAALCGVSAIGFSIAAAT